MARSIGWLAALALVAASMPAVADWAQTERFETQAAPARCATCIQRLPDGGWRIADDEGGLAAISADGKLLWRIDPRFDGARAETMALALAPDGAACIIQRRRIGIDGSVVAARIDPTGVVAWSRLASATAHPLLESQALACRADGGATLALGDRVQSRDAIGELAAETPLADGRLLLAAVGLADGRLVTATSAAAGGAPLSLQRYTAAAGLEDERIEDLAPSTSGHVLVADSAGGVALVRVRHAAAGATAEIAATRFDPGLAERWRSNLAITAPVLGIGARAQDDGGLAVSIRLDDATEGLRVGWWGADGTLRWSPYFAGNDPQDGGNVRFAASTDGTLWFAISRGADTVWRTDVRQVAAGGTLLRRAVIDDATALGVRRIDLAGGSRVALTGIAGIAEDPTQPVAAGTTLQFGVGATVLFRGLPVPMTGTAQSIALDGTSVVGTAHADGPLRSTLRTVAWSLDGSETLRREQPFDGRVGSARSVLLGDGAVLQVAIDDPTQGPRRFVARRLDATLAWTRSIEETAARRVVDAWRLSPTEAIALLDTGRLMRIALDGGAIVGQSLVTPGTPQGVRRAMVGGSEQLLAWELRNTSCWARAFDLQGSPLAAVDALCGGYPGPPFDESTGWATRRADGAWLMVSTGIESGIQQRLRYRVFAPDGRPEANSAIDLQQAGVLTAMANPDGAAAVAGSNDGPPVSFSPLLRFAPNFGVQQVIAIPGMLRPDGAAWPVEGSGVEWLGFARVDGRAYTARLGVGFSSSAPLAGTERLQPGALALAAAGPFGEGVLLAAGQSADPAPDRAGHAVFLRMAAPLFANGFE
jgi:hypothetical protein